MFLMQWTDEITYIPMIYHLPLMEIQSSNQSLKVLILAIGIPFFEFYIEFMLCKFIKYPSEFTINSKNIRVKPKKVK